MRTTVPSGRDHCGKCPGVGAAEIGAERHELAVPIDLLYQSEIVEVTDFDDQMIVSLTSKR